MKFLRGYVIMYTEACPGVDVGVRYLVVCTMDLQCPGAQAVVLIPEDMAEDYLKAKGPISFEDLYTFGIIVVCNADTPAKSMGNLWSVEASDSKIYLSKKDPNITLSYEGSAIDEFESIIREGLEASRRQEVL